MTIQPGAIIQFSSADLTIAGTLNAQGTALNKILFTSVDDDSGRDGIAGNGDDMDTGGNGPTTGSAGNWGQIHFTNTSTSNQLTHAEIRYGGNFETVLAEGPLTMSETTIRNSLNAATKIQAATATLTNNTFTSNGSIGLVLENAGSSTVTGNTFSNNGTAGTRIVTSTPTLTNNTWSGNTGSAISMDLVSTPVITGSSFSNNGINGVKLDNGTLSGSNSWNNPDVVYVLSGTIAVSAGATLTIGVGQVIKATTNTGDQLQVDGTLIADGTDDEPIIFTSLLDDSIGGDTNNDGASSGGTWNGIGLTPTSTSSLFDYVQIRNVTSVSGALRSDATFTITNSSISNSGDYGLRINGGNPVITNVDITNSFLGAISSVLNSNPVISGGSYINNGINGIRFDGGTLAGNTTWDNTGIVYWMAGEVIVPGGVTLTVAPGQVVKFAGTGITINGTLNADGTDDEAIIFTSTEDDTAGGDTNNDGVATSGADGGTHRLAFLSGSTGNILDYTEVRFMNGSTGAIEVDNAALTLSNGVVTGTSLEAGIDLTNGSVVSISNTAFENQIFNAGITTDLISIPTVSNVTFAGNLINGILLEGGTINSNETWSTPGAVIVLNSDVTVASGVTLTVAAGSIIKPRHSAVDLLVDGTLNIAGTSTQPVIVTSFHDDTAGGDTNGDAAATSPSVLNWHRIVFNSTSTGSVLNHVDVRYGDHLLADQSAITMTNSVIRNMHSEGIRLLGSDSSFENTVIRNNGHAAVHADLASDPSFSDMTILNNFVNGVELYPGTLPGNFAINDPDIVYWIGDDIIVPVGTTLTIAPGQVIKFGGASEFIVDGTLDAQGTIAQPIIFTSDSDDAAGGGRTYANIFNPLTPSRGDWPGITFNSGSTGNVLDMVEVRYSGGGNSNTGSLTIKGADVTVTDSVFRDSLRPNIRIEQGASPSITGNVFRDGQEAALSMDLQSSPVIQNNTIFGHGFNHLLLDGGTMPVGNWAWNNTEVLYQIQSDITVPVGATLTIAPGQIIKATASISFGINDALIVNGTLNAIGTVDQPIIFTSYFDDSAGGRSVPRDLSFVAIGSWTGLVINGTATMDHVDIRYAGISNPGLAAVAVLGGDLTLTNSTLQHNYVNRAVFANDGAQLIVNNSFIFDGGSVGVRAEGSGTVATVVNNTIHGLTHGVAVADSGTLNLHNNILSNNSSGVFVETGGVLNATYNDVFSTGINYDGTADLTGTNGNISADPLYFNAASFQFQLKAQSPALDAGTSTLAPATDFYGNPRFDQPLIPNTGAGTSPFVDMGALERLAVVASDIDLITTSVIPDTSTALPADVIGVEWTVQNIGEGAAPGSWLDGIYLSKDGLWTPDDLLLKQVTHSQYLGPGLSYSASTTVTLPAVLPGEYHIIVRTNSGNDIFEGQTLSNNAGASELLVTMDLLPAILGTPRVGEIASSGKAQYYKVTVPAGDDLNVILDGQNDSTNELYVRFGDLPSRQQFDARGNRNSPDQAVSLANTIGGDYYILVYGEDIPTPETFSVLTSLAGFSISSVGPAVGSNTGEVTLTIRGAQFDGNSMPRIIDGNGTLNPIRVYYTDSGLLSATFDLTGRPVGLADVEVVNTGNVITSLQDSFEIVSGESGRLVTNLVAPSRVRPDRDFTVYLEYSNVGQTDILAPVIQLNNAGFSPLSIYSDRRDSALSLNLIGVGADYPAGILPPGATIRMPLYSHSTPTTGGNTYTTVIADYTDALIDWDGMESLIRPDGLADADWNTIYTTLQNNVGDTWNDFERMISINASLHPGIEGSNSLLDDVLDLEIAKAFAELNTSISGKVYLNDTAHPAAGVLIQLYNPATEESFETFSLNDGTYLFPYVDDGTYDVLFPGFVSAGTSEITIAGTDQNNVDLTVTPGAIISGSVLLTPRGVPLRDVVITATNADDGRVFTTASDSFGRYRIDSLPAGDYTIIAGGDTYAQSTLTVSALMDGNERALVNFSLNLGGSISGFVNNLGLPIENAIVSAIGEDGSGFSATTDASGAFVIGGLGPQTYRIVASTLTGLVAGELTGIELEEDEDLSGVDFALVAGGEIAGTVTRLGGLPASYQLIELENGGLRFSAQTDEDGNYELSGLPAGNYAITIPGSITMKATGNAVITPGASTDADFVLSPLATIEGVVTNSVTSLPLPGVTVFAMNDDGLIAVDVTDVAGHYEFTGLDEDTYAIYLGDFGTPGAQRTTVIASPSNTDIDHDFSVAVAGLITGTIFEADGVTPAEDSIIRLKQGNDSILSVMTEGGNYSLVVLTAGTYEVLASVDGLTYSEQSTVVGGGSTVDIDFTPGVRTISGVVEDNGALPIEGATVLIYLVGPDSSLSLVKVIQTGSDGAFSVTGLADGSYRVTALADGLAEERTDAVVAGSDPVPLTFSLDPEGRLEGVISDLISSAPLAGAELRLINQANGIAVALLADADGNYIVENLLPGTYDVIAFASDHQALIGSTTIAAGDNTLNLELAAFSTQLSGQVTSISGPLPFVLVQAKDSNGRVLGEAETDENGNYLINSLPAGEYTLTVEAGGYLDTSSQNVTLAGGDNLTGQNFILQVSVISDPVDHPGVNLGNDERDGGVLGWLTTVFRTPTRNPGQPNASDLSGLLDMEHCRKASLAAIRAVKQAEQMFRNWEYIAEGSFTGLLREATTSLLQFTVAGGKIATALNPAPIQETLDLFKAGSFAALMTPATYELLKGTSELMADVTNLYYALKSQLNGDAGDLAGIAGTLADLGGKLVSVGEKMLASQQAIAALQGSPVPTGGMLGFLGKIVKILDAGIATASAITDSLAGIDALVDQFAAIDNAKKAYQNADLAARIAVSNLKECRPDGDPEDGEDEKKKTPKIKFPKPGTPPPPPPPPPPPGGPTPPPPPPPSPTNAPSSIPGPTSGTLVSTSSDPNLKTGPNGYSDTVDGDGGAEFIQPGVMPYLVQFENDPILATAAAQIVEITDVLDTDLDLDTLEFTSFGFGNFTFEIPAGLSSYQTTLDLRPDGINLLVPASFQLDEASRTITVRIESLDPDTMLPPDGVDDGFLPVNNANHDGEGFFTYIISPNENVVSGTEIRNIASIVFDLNAPIVTPETLNTIDAEAPTSEMDALQTTSRTLSLPLSWTGDDGDGSGIASYNVYVSDNGGAFTLLLAGTTETSTVFAAENGHTYGFAVVATDNVGFVEGAALTAETTTTIDVEIMDFAAGNPLKFTDANGDLITVTLSGPGAGQAILQNGLLTGSDLDIIELSGTTLKSSLSFVVKKAGGGDGLTDINHILTTGVEQSLNAIKGKAVNLGSGLVTERPELEISGALKSVLLNNIAANSTLLIGSDFDDVDDQLDIAALKPLITVGNINDAVVFQVEGSVKGFNALSWAFDGSLTAASAIGTIKVKGGLAAEITGTTIGSVAAGFMDGADLTATTGSIGNLTIKSGIIANTTIEALLGNVGNITAKLTKQTGTVTAIDNLSVSAQRIGNITGSISTLLGVISASALTNSDFSASTGSIGNVTATVTGAGMPGVFTGIVDTEFNAATTIGKLNTIRADGLSAYAGGAISGLSVTSKIKAFGILENSTVIAGQSQTIAAIADLTKGGLGAVSVSGNVSETILAARGNIKSVNVGHDMSGSKAVAGVNVGADQTLLTTDDTYHRHASIASVKVGGALEDSSIITGIDPGDDAIWGAGSGADADSIGALIGALTNGKLGPIILGIATVLSENGTFFGNSPVSDHNHAIQAPTLTSVQIGKIKQKDFTSPLWIDADLDGTEDSNEMILRTLS